MIELVFLEPNRLGAVPFTTLEVIAEFAGVKHHAIQQLVTKHETDFKEFGVIAFEIWNVSSPTVDKLKLVADYFGVTLDALLREDEPTTGKEAT